MSVYSDSLRFEKTRWEKDPYSEEANYLYKEARGKNEIVWRGPKGEANGKKDKVWRKPEGEVMSPTKKLLSDVGLREELFHLMNFIEFVEYEVVNVRCYDCILDKVEGVKEWKGGIKIPSLWYFTEICGCTMEDGRKALNIAFVKR